MKKQHQSKCVIGIAPSNRGFGFAVLDESQKLMDWGVKSVKGDKNAQCLFKIGDLITHYNPNAIVIEDCESKGSRRSSRIRALSKEISILAAKQKVRVILYPRKKVLETFFIDGGTKFALAKLISVRFPNELGARLPPKRRPWMSEDYRMGIFDAVALVLIFSAQQDAKKAKMGAL